jgi:hypothetical protein
MVYNRKPFGVRELLQEWGTELRRAEDKDYWVKRWLETASQSDKPVVAPDMRFPNEVSAVQKLGGWLWRVHRPHTPTGDHESEVALDFYPFDTMLTNSGTIEDLHSQVDMLIGEKSGG